MLEKEIYLDLAKRFIAASKLEMVEEKPKIEIAGFNCYHAYESVACAVLEHFERSIPDAHASKLQTFFAVLLSKRKIKTNPHAINKLNYKIIGFRNKFLYPFIDRNSLNVQHPKDAISKVELEKMQNQVEGIIKIMEKIIQS